MQHTVLARKWRPKDFTDLVGQDQSVTILTNIIKSNKLHHAYLLTGTRGVGKTTIARIISKALNCLSPINGAPCKTCSNCLAIDTGSLVDVIEIDAASNTGVDNVREIIENSQYAPTSAKYKVYIIDEVHMLSKSAFNAMLKTLEEPPSHVIFILATTDPQKIPITILSRCLQLKLQPINSKLIQAHLVKVVNHEQIPYETGTLTLLANAANGSMRDALSLLDQAIAFSNNNLTMLAINEMLGVTEDSIILDLLSFISQLKVKELIALKDTIIEQGYDLENTLQQLNNYLYLIALEQLGVSSNNSAVRDLASQLNVNNIQLYFEIINLALGQLSQSNNKATIFGMTLLRLISFNLGDNLTGQVVLTKPTLEVIPNDAKISAQNIDEAITTPKIEVLEELKGRNPTNIIDIKTQVASLAMDKAMPLEANSTSITNWVQFIEDNKANFDNHIYPLLENAKLIKQEANTIFLEIDQRYASSFTADTSLNINAILTKLLKRTIISNINFNDSVTHTVKAKKLTLIEEKQIAAKASIAADIKLNSIKTQFSATILDISIKPL